MSAHAGGISAPVSRGNGPAVRTTCLTNGRSCAIIVPKMEINPVLDRASYAKADPCIPSRPENAATPGVCPNFPCFLYRTPHQPPRLCVSAFSTFTFSNGRVRRRRAFRKWIKWQPIFLSLNTLPGICFVTKCSNLLEFFPASFFLARGAMAPPAPTNPGPLSARRMRKGCPAGDSGIASRLCYG